MSIIKALYDYFLACPLMQDRRLNVDMLPEDTRRSGVEYSIDSLPGADEISTHVDGGAICRYQFTINSVNDYEQDALYNMQNSNFFEDLSEWLRGQNKSRNLPVLSEGLQCLNIQAINTASLMNVQGSVGKYQIQCRMTYYRKGER